MKHHLSSFRRSSALRILCILILAVMCAPAAMAAAVTHAAPTLATIGGFGPLAVVGGLGLAGLGLLNAAKDDGTENGGGEPQALDPAVALAQVLDDKLTIGQRLKVAAAALRGIAPTAQFTQVQAELVTAKEQLTAKDSEITRLQAALKTAEEKLTARNADVEALDQEKAALAKENETLKTAEQDLEKRASLKAKQIAQSVGIDANKLPAAQGEGQTETGSKAAYTAFAKEMNPDLKAELFQTYKLEVAREKKAAA